MSEGMNFLIVALACGWLIVFVFCRLAGIPLTPFGVERVEKQHRDRAKKTRLFELLEEQGLEIGWFIRKKTLEEYGERALVELATSILKIRRERDKLTSSFFTSYWSANQEVQYDVFRQFAGTILQKEIGTDRIMDAPSKIQSRDFQLELPSIAAVFMFTASREDAVRRVLEEIHELLRYFKLSSRIDLNWAFTEAKVRIDG